MQARCDLGLNSEPGKIKLSERNIWNFRRMTIDYTAAFCKC